MLAKEVVSEKYATVPEVKDLLTKRSKVDELRYEQRTALEYATRFSRTAGKEARRLVDKLMQEIEGLKEHQAVLIVNLLPIDRNDLQLIFAKERIRLDDSKIDAILRTADGAKLIALSEIQSELEKARLAEKEALEAEAAKQKEAGKAEEQKAGKAEESEKPKKPE